MFDKGLPALAGALAASIILFIANQVTELPDKPSQFNPFSPAPSASICPTEFTELATPTGEAAKVLTHTAGFDAKLTKVCESPWSYLRRYEGDSGVKWYEQDKVTGNTKERAGLH